MLRWLGLQVLTVGAVMLIGCHAPGLVDAVDGSTVSEAAEPAAVDPTSLVVVNPLGRRTTIGQVVGFASKAEVLLVGETHGNAAGRAWTRALWEAVRESQDTAMLSLEFLERDQQRALDDAWLFGEPWPVEESMGFGLPLACGGRVIASNAPRRYVSAYRKEGLAFVERMTPEQRRLVVVPEEVGELIGGRYREDFERAMQTAMAGHGKREMSEEGLDAFYRAQLMWDATMADSIVKGLADGYLPVVQVVGRFHSDFQGGLVEYIRRFMPGVTVVTVSLVDAEPPVRGWREGDRYRAHFVVYLRPRADWPEADE
ncbi:MAG: ChaN family lipoprotein [Planctomycetota bacterium]